MKTIHNLKSIIYNLTNHRHIRKYEKYATLAIWMLAIYYLSSRSLNVFTSPTIWDFLLRKMAHMFEFAVLTFLIFRILGQTEKRHMNWNIFWSLVFAVMYAVSDEYHQTFVHGRVGTYKDVLIDSSGALIAAWLLLVDYHHRKIMESKNLVNKISKILKGTK